MSSIKSWIAAARLRTLPLSISGILLGSFNAASEGKFDGLIFSFSILTTLFLQVLSNYANDYGDGVRGTDVNRIGEKRVVASGEVTPQQMKSAVVWMSILSFVSAMILIYISFHEEFYWACLFVFLAMACLWAAVKYTVGKSAYGYGGFGDLFVFLFFGIVSVWGCYTLYQHQTFTAIMILPSASIGLLSTAVLNLNNLRDMETDRIAGKLTIPLRIGFFRGKVYQAFLLLIPFILSSYYLILLYQTQWFHFFFLVLILPTLLILKTLFETKEPKLLDKELKKVALLTLAFSIFLGIGLIL